MKKGQRVKILVNLKDIPCKDTMGTVTEHLYRSLVYVKLDLTGTEHPFYTKHAKTRESEVEELK